MLDAAVIPLLNDRRCDPADANTAAAVLDAAAGVLDAAVISLLNDRRCDLADANTAAAVLDAAAAPLSNDRCYTTHAATGVVPLLLDNWFCAAAAAAAAAVLEAAVSLSFLLKRQLPETSVDIWKDRNQQAQAPSDKLCEH